MILRLDGSRISLTILSIDDPSYVVHATHNEVVATGRPSQVIYFVSACSNHAFDDPGLLVVRVVSAEAPSLRVMLRWNP